jgi:hypothetical protein
MSSTHVLYCHCAYAQIVPKEVKEAVLQRLCESGVAFDAVADLCEMSARQDPALQRLGSCGQMKIAACYPRAVKWLFAAARAPLSVERVEILNMRTQSAGDVVQGLLNSELHPNVPIDGHEKGGPNASAEGKADASQVNAEPLRSPESTVSP